MLRKTVLIGLCFAVVSAMAVSAGGSQEAGATAEKKVFMIYWHPDHMYDNYLKVIDEFEAEKNLKIEKVVMAWDDYKTKINSDFAAGTPPDLAEVHHTWTIEFGLRGQVENLTDMVKAWPESEDWFESTWTDVSDIEGNIYGVKMHHTCYAMFWNRAIFKDAGLDPDEPPATLEELADYVDMFHNTVGPDIKGYGFDPKGQFLTPFFVTEKTPYLVMDGKVTLDGPAARKTVKLLNKLARSGKTYVPDPGGSAARVNVRAMFLGGKFAMQISGPWELGNIKKNYPDFDYNVVMPPHISGVESRTNATGTAMCIPTDAKHPELAWELLKRIVDPEVEVATTIEAGMLMPRKSWASDPRIQDLKEVKYFKPLLPFAHSFDIAASQLVLPEITHFGHVWDNLYESMIYTDKDMDQAIDEYVEEANGMIKEKLRG